MPIRAAKFVVPWLRPGPAKIRRLRKPDSGVVRLLVGQSRTVIFRLVKHNEVPRRPRGVLQNRARSRIVFVEDRTPRGIAGLEIDWRIHDLLAISEVNRKREILQVCRSSRVLALNGLRMMPLFPRPSLKFRTVSFPQYGFKADLSDGAFLLSDLLKPTPGIHKSITSLHPPFVSFQTET